MAKVVEFGSIEDVPWQEVTPNEKGDWINRRSEVYDSFIPLSIKKNKDNGEFSIFSLSGNGLLTNRDSWLYNFSHDSLVENVKRFLSNYQGLVGSLKEGKSTFDEISEMPKSEISWSRGLLNRAKRFESIIFEENSVVLANYRPFTRKYAYREPKAVEMQAKTSLFPKHAENILLGTTNVSQSEFSCLAFRGLADLGFLMGDCYPLNIFEEVADEDRGTIDFGNSQAPRKKDGISDWALSHFRERCKDQKITKLDIFHYVYAVLNSPDYLAKFAQDARKSGPKVPVVQEFRIFAEAGKKLLELHLNYDKLEPSDLTNLKVENNSLKDGEEYRVKKMSLSKNADMLTLTINQHISISNIPVEVLNYTVNGRSPIEWLVNQYQETIDKDSKITNDPNDLSSDPKYFVKLAQSLIKLSIESNHILGSLPTLTIVKD